MHDILARKTPEKQQKLALVYAGVFIIYCSVMMLMATASPTQTPKISESQVNMMLIVQGVFSFAVFAGVAVVFMAAVLKIEPLSLLEKISLKGVLQLFAIAILMMVSYAFIAEWNMNLELPDSSFSRWARHSEDAMKSMIEQLTNFQSPLHFMIALLVIGVIAAVGEEYFFRGLLQNLLFKGTKNPHVAIWITALVFSAIHMQFFGFVPRLIIGALLGYIYYWSGNLAAPIIIHFINNGLGVCALYFSQISNLDIKSDDLDKAPPWYITIVGIIALSYLLIQYKKQHQKQVE